MSMGPRVDFWKVKKKKKWYNFSLAYLEEKTALQRCKKSHKRVIWTVKC